jgi:DNA-binding protein HU-beta
LTWGHKTSLIAPNFPTRQEGAVNKAELVEAVATATGLDKRQAEAAVGAFVESVVSKTKAGEPVSIFGFGAFKPTARAARKGRNPQTGAPVKIAASKSVKFQPATAFKTVLNTRGAAKKATAKKATATVTKKATAKAAPAAKATTTKATKATKAPAAKAAKAATKAPAARATTAKATPAKTAPVKTTTAKRAAPSAKTSAAKKSAPATRTAAVKKVTVPTKTAAKATKKRG